MSDSSEDEDLSRFQEVIDTSFTKLINESREKSSGKTESSQAAEPNPKSERHLETSSHYNDVRVPAELQKRIGAKVSAVIDRNVEFVDVQQNGIKKRKTKGGVKLFKESKDFLSCEEAPDTYTEGHNRDAKKIKEIRRRHVGEEGDDLDEHEKIAAVAVSGDYVLSKGETKHWKSRRKEKLFRYKSQGKGKVLTAVE